MKTQFRSVIQWNNPEDGAIFQKITDVGDEIKNASQVVILPGQGAMIVSDGKIAQILVVPGTYDLNTANVPFITTLKSVMNNFESPHKVAIWFFKVDIINNIRWGTRGSINYVDPVYKFPIGIGVYGNYSIKIIDYVNFFTKLVNGKFFCSAIDLQDIFLSRISQPITSYLATSQYSYETINANLENISVEIFKKIQTLYKDFGLELCNFQVEGISLDEATSQRVASISDTQAEVNSARIAGLDYAELQRIKALRDAAGAAGPATSFLGVANGIDLAKIQAGESKKATPVERLKLLKDMLDADLITNEEYEQKKKNILEEM